MRETSAHADFVTTSMSPFKAKLRWTRRSVLAMMMMVIGAVSVLGGFWRASATPPVPESALIEALIQCIAAMTNLKCIRNGAKATLVQSAGHIRDKYVPSALAVQILG